MGYKLDFNQGNNLPRCAILMAVYNGMQFIEEQITSIFAQKEVELTIFVSIDPSNDNSEEWLQALSRQEKKLKILPAAGRFGGAAKNFFRLIKDTDFSEFDYVAFADQDDYWYAEKLVNAIFILKSINYDAYSSNVIAFWPNGKQILINKAQPQKQWDFIFEAAGPGCTYVISNRLAHLIKHNVINCWDRLQAIGLHDWYCYAFARANGFKWFIDPRPTMLYRQHEKNQVGANLGLKAYIHRFKKIKDGWWLSQASLIAELVGAKENNLIKQWPKFRRKDFIKLAINAPKCRRDRKSQLVFFLVCLYFAVISFDKYIINSKNSD